MSSLVTRANRSRTDGRKGKFRKSRVNKRLSSFPTALPGSAPIPAKDEPLGDFAYRVLRDTIRSGKIMPREHLREVDVAQWLKISRTPVREAFHRLISESLLTNGPWNGVMVADFDVRQLTELYAVRESLEGTAAALAARNATRADLEAIEKIIVTEAKETRPDKCVVINRNLHEIIYQAAHNRYLLQSLNSVVDALGLLHHSTFVLSGSVEQAHQEHLNIIAAIRARNPARAERLARKHVRHSLKLRLQLYRRHRMTKRGGLSGESSPNRHSTFEIGQRVFAS
jgi:DNA-binding GntR family transcriptional regulator